MIVIIGVLAAFGVPKFLNSVEKSKAAEAFNYLSAIQSAQERYLAQNGVMPVRSPALDITLPPRSTSRWAASRRRPAHRLAWLVARARPEFEFELFVQRRLESGWVRHDQLDHHDLPGDLPGDDQLGRQWQRQWQWQWQRRQQRILIARWRGG